ncbi:MAG TPA: CorA family divalent cation transporter, partial [Bacteroidales bacterium]|nr:CorA family divalent cation transporter [Bacteroidales bacterium]
MGSSFVMHVSSTGKADVLPATPELDSNSLYIWHHFHQPTEEDLKNLPVEYGLHPLAIEDCMDDDQIPKMESFPKNTHLIFNTFNYHHEDIHAEEVNLFIGEKFIITVTRSERLNQSIT